MSEGVEQVTSGGVSTPQVNNVVDGGKASEAEAELARLRSQLEEREAAYKGMQRNYNSLHQRFTERDTQYEELNGRLAEFEAREQSLTTERERVQGEVASRDEQLNAAQAQLEDMRKMQEMSQMIDTEFPALIGMKGILNPGMDIEATRQMLSEVNKTVVASIQQGVRNEIGGDYPPGGSVSRGAAPSLGDLRNMAIEKAGASDYMSDSTPYWAMLGESGEYPKPPVDRYGDT